MNFSELSLIAVVAASIASFAFGALWYSPLLLLKKWGQAAAVDTDQPMANQGRVFALSFIFTVFSALLLSVILGASPGLISALIDSACIAAALVVTSMGINYQFAGRASNLWLIDGGFHIFRFMIMGAVLSFF